MSNAVHNIYAVNRWRPIAGSPSLATDESVLVIIPVTSAAGVSPNRQRLLSLVDGQAHCSFTALDTLERMTATLADYIRERLKVSSGSAVALMSLCTQRIKVYSMVSKKNLLQVLQGVAGIKG
ncbi:hypothetical protein HG619_11855 [Pseudomonas syringae]|nr:hypothetical protein [Pseudomonas syringae]